MKGHDPVVLKSLDDEFKDNLFEDGLDNWPDLLTSGMSTPDRPVNPPRRAACLRLRSKVSSLRLLRSSWTNHPQHPSKRAKETAAHVHRQLEHNLGPRITPSRTQSWSESKSWSGNTVASLASPKFWPTTVNRRE